MMSWDTTTDFIRRYRLYLTILGVVLAIVMYTARVGSNPPGFYLDESSIAFNAHTISQSGRDEHGIPWPLYFRAFGDYKNPVHVYLLAALFKLTGPGVVVARLLSAISGMLSAFLLGLLGARISRRWSVGVFVTCHALLTPWLFETSRLVMEVAIYPLTLALFLFYLYKISHRLRWSSLQVATLALALALLTYTYSIGRLFGPLLALGLALFINRERWPSVLKTWGVYLVTLLPILIFNSRHPGTLTARFKLISYLRPEDGYGSMLIEFARHYLGHLNPWRLLVDGQPNPDIFVNGHLLFATVVLATLGGCLVVRHHLRDAWWRFIIYGLFVSIVPAALTKEYFHLLRLTALPVFLIVLTVPAIALLLEKSALRKSWRIAFVSLLVLTLIQAAFVQWQFHGSAGSAKRRHQFDADYSQTIMVPAVSAARAIYLADGDVPGYMQAYWHGLLLGIEHSRFVLLPPHEPYPSDAMVIATEKPCRSCRVISQTEPYSLFVTTEAGRRLYPLTGGGFRAELQLVNEVGKLRVKEQVTLLVKVKNTSGEPWLAPERIGEHYVVRLGNHWLNDQNEVIIVDDGRSTLLEDLKPGAEIELTLTINAPAKPGPYLLELDMVQEGVAWFRDQGSASLKLPVKVE